ncbi:MAG TPA: sugar phosphate isomerase/epimerase family protein [Spirochaetia bacterium]|nr:sugar phosphate isomerase/epimerase family protein [Spirochaetia bacterium]
MAHFTLSAFADEIDPDLKTQMDVLEQHGINHIEMRGVGGKGLVEYSLEEVRGIKRELDARGFRISSIGSPVGKIRISDEFAPHLELFRHTLEISRIMESRYIRMFSFFLPEGEDPSQFRREVMDRWRQFIRAAESYDVVLLHENEKNIYGDTPDRCLDLFETMGSDSFMAVFDPANFVQCGVETYPSAFGVLKDRIAYMHIKDAVAGESRVVPAGEGDGKIKEILLALSRRGYEGFLSLEPHLAAFQGSAALELAPAFEELPEGGARTFAVAVEALKKILREIPG